MFSIKKITGINHINHDHYHKYESRDEYICFQKTLPRPQTEHQTFLQFYIVGRTYSIFVFHIFTFFRLGLH